jgi:CHAT domain-containing protein/tetratricopeptide (TPR) repeat protein
MEDPPVSLRVVMHNHCKAAVSRTTWIVLLIIAICSSVQVGQSQSLPDFIAAYQNISKLLAEGKTDAAIALGENILHSQGKQPDRQRSDRVAVVYVLAVAYSQKGAYGDEVHLLKQETQALEQVGAKTVELADLYAMMASPCGMLGRDAEAESSATRAVEIYDSQLAPDDIRIANALFTLAAQEAVLGKSAEQLHSLKRALTIASVSSSPFAPQAMKGILLALASLYDGTGDRERGGEFRKRALSITSASVGGGATFAEYTESGAIGLAALRAGNFAEAITAFTEQLTIAKRLVVSSPNSEMLVKQLLAVAYIGAHDPAKARPVVLEGLDAVFADYEHDFALMDEHDRLAFAAAADARIGLFCSYVHQYHDRDPESVEEMYDLALWSKGVILETTSALQERLRTTQNPDLITLRTEFEDQRRSYQEAVNANSPTSSELRTRMQATELTIVGKLGLPQIGRPTWQSVQQQLNLGGVAVEILRFHYNDGQPTSSVYYAALILRAGWSHPKYVFLGTEEQLRREDLSAYLLYATAKFPMEAPRLKFWNVLESQMGKDVTKVYLSPDGVFTNVAFAIIPDTHGTLLFDKYDIRTVSSTRRLSFAQTRLPTSPRAVLVGDPAFGSSQEKSSAIRAEGQPSSIVLPASEGSEWGALPGTAIQVGEVAEILRQHQWRVESLTGTQATKARVLGALVKPQVVHFATHGFFTDRSSVWGSLIGLRTDDAMLNSGLVLTGANITSIDKAQSLLTAYEISSLDLSSTALIVLSACETGLSDTVTGAEVFGLRRAFHIAGAESVMMTMWMVPEEQASDIVETFYLHWMAGEDKHDALKAAQRKARERTRQPYYWGAFVLVDN